MAGSRKRVNKWFLIANIIGFYVFKDDRWRADTDWVVGFVTQCIVLLKEPPSVHWRRQDIGLQLGYFRTWWAHLQQCKESSSLCKMCDIEVLSKVFFDTANRTQALFNCKTIKDVPLGGWLQFCCQRLELVHNCNKILTLTIPHVVLSMKVARYISNWLPETSQPGCKISSTGGERLSGPELTVELLSLSLADSWAPRVWKKSPTSKWMLIP